MNDLSPEPGTATGRGARSDEVKGLDIDDTHANQRLDEAQAETPWTTELIYARQREQLPPCRANCPSGIDIRGWINIIAQHDKTGLSLEEAKAAAWRRLVECNPLPAILGRVCPHTCETECNRGDKEGAVSIHAMERFIGDWAIERGLQLPVVDETHREESIGVIGSGPAGLSFAYQMARHGYPVTVYEQHEQPGGMLRYGIPEYRLPREVLRAEIARIAALGVEFRFGIRIGSHIRVAELMSRHRAVFIGIGADQPLRLQISGENGPGVLSGTQLMFRVNEGHSIDLGESAVVVGGGNTAIDAARAARRLGAQVTLLYRRTQNEMPAIAEEVEDAEAEGVHIQYLAAPEAILRDGERIIGVRVQKMTLGELDASGRRRPVPIDGDIHEIPASAVIGAVSQRPDWEPFADLNLGGETIRVDEFGRIADGFWTGGDALGLGTATQALGHGRRAAEALRAELEGSSLQSHKKADPLRSEVMHLDYYAPGTRVEPFTRPAEERLKAPTAEARLNISEQQFLEEISRCLSCGNCLGCQLCWMFCNAGAYTPGKAPEPGHYFDFDPDLCEGCGKCIELCPCGYLKPKAAPNPNGTNFSRF